MSLLSVVQDVCAVVGVARPTAVFASINTDRTMFEMLALANEMAERIATDARDWTMLRKTVGPVTTPLTPFVGDGVSEAFNLPADYRRMLTNGNVWRSSSTIQPMRFIPDTDEWLQRRAAAYEDGRGEWTIYGGQMHIRPIMDAGISLWANGVQYAVGVTVRDPDDTSLWASRIAHTSVASGSFSSDRAAHQVPSPYWAAAAKTSARFSYLDKNSILSGGQPQEHFVSDADTFRLPERILKLGMIWQWKANKGSPYAEDMGTYQDAMGWAMGSDSPAPLIIGHMPLSTAARTAYPFWPVPTP